MFFFFVPAVVEQPVKDKIGFLYFYDILVFENISIFTVSIIFLGEIRQTENFKYMRE
jgi:hypothetical protein